MQAKSAAFVVAIINGDSMADAAQKVVKAVKVNLPTQIMPKVIELAFCCYAVTDMAHALLFASAPELARNRA